MNKVLKPKQRDFPYYMGYHAAMSSYARTFDKSSLSVEVVYKDGSVFNDIFNRATKELKYYLDCGEGKEDYYVTVDTGSYEPDYLYSAHDVKFDVNGSICKPVTAGKLKKMFAEWVEEHIETPASIKWKTAQSE